MDVLMHEFMLHIENKIVVNYTAWEDFMKDVKSHDGSFLVKFEPRKKRSLNQNSFYWAVVIPIVKDALRDAGFDDVKSTEDVHTILKSTFLKKQIPNHKTGECLEVIRSTTELTTKEFKDFIDEVGKWCAEYLSVYLPAPGQQSIMQL